MLTMLASDSITFCVNVAETLKQLLRQTTLIVFGKSYYISQIQLCYNYYISKSIAIHIEYVLCFCRKNTVW